MDSSSGSSTNYWERKPISLQDIGMNFAISTFIVATSGEISNFLSIVAPGDDALSTIVRVALGNKFLLMTTLSMLLATFASKKVSQVAGSQEIGTYLIYLFFFVIGVPASFSQIVGDAPMLFLFCGLIVLGNMLVTFGVGKLLKFDLEEIIMASNANIGGGTTAAAMAISKGWVKLVGPVMLIGTLGYVLGTWIGVGVGVFLGAPLA